MVYMQRTTKHLPQYIIKGRYFCKVYFAQVFNPVPPCFQFQIPNHVSLSISNASFVFHQFTAMIMCVGWMWYGINATTKHLVG